MISLAASERRKYREIWKYDVYRRHSPGEQVLPLFRQMVRKRGTLLDIGCGTGRAGLALNAAGFEVSLADFVDAVERDSRELTFHKVNVWGQWPTIQWDYGYCADMLEHLPTAKLDQALRRILSHCERVFFSVHFGPDACGQLVGEPLHLTVQPFSWWVEKLGQHGTVREARDLIGMGVFYVAR